MMLQSMYQKVNTIMWLSKKTVVLNFENLCPVFTFQLIYFVRAVLAVFVMGYFCELKGYRKYFL